MWKFIAGVILGGAIMAGILIPVIFDQRREKLSLGLKHGNINGQLFVIEFLSKYFGSPSYQNESNCVDEISCKDRSIIIVNEAGKTTLKIR